MVSSIPLSVITIHKPKRITGSVVRHKRLTHTLGIIYLKRIILNVVKRRNKTQWSQSNFRDCVYLFILIHSTMITKFILYSLFFIICISLIVIMSVPLIQEPTYLQASTAHCHQLIWYTWSSKNYCVLSSVRLYYF